MKFISVKTGKEYTGTLPTSVTLPVHKNKPIPHSIEVVSKKGDDNWLMNLERYMWYRGYMMVDTNSGLEELTKHLQFGVVV